MVFFDICSVGVMGDVCMYDYIIGICVVILIDGMIFDWVCIFWDVFEVILMCIVNEVKYINCVVYDIISKLFVIIEWE